MNLRSLLFVPGDRPERFEKAENSGADAIIIDMEDSVSPANKAKAREAVASYAASRQAVAALFIRINPLTSHQLDEDINVVRAARPDGVVLPKCEGGETVVMLSERLDAAGCAATTILPIATETPSAIFKLGSFGAVKDRICGLTWGAEDLPAAIGAATSREIDGRYTAPYEMVRSLALFAAHAAGVQAIETVFPDLRNPEALRAYAERGRRDGFTGMMAIHPDQVPIINEAFMPDDAEIAKAQAVVEAFQANPGAGVIELDGRMLDLPHLKAAMQVLSIGKRAR